MFNTNDIQKQGEILTEITSLIASGKIATFKLFCNTVPSKKTRVVSFTIFGFVLLISSAVFLATSTPLPFPSVPNISL